MQSLSTGGYVVAWRSDAQGASSVFLQRFDSNGVKVGGEIPVDDATSTYENYPAVAATSDGGLIVAYAGQVVRDGSYYYTTLVQRFDSSGNKVGDAVVVVMQSGTSATDVDIAVLSSGAFVVTWETNTGNIYTQLFDANGGKIGTEYRVPSVAYDVAVSASSDGGYIITWGDSSNIQTMRFREDGAPVLPTITGDYLPNNITGSSSDSRFGVYLSGGDGNDILRTGSSSSGGDWLEGGAGSDELIGGNGDDTYVADDLDRIVELANGGNDTVRVTSSYTLTADQVENLTLVGPGAASLTGNSIANVLTGNGADNVLNGGLGADRMVGGNGNDTYIVDHAPDSLISDPGDVVVEELNGGTDTVISEINYILPSHVEILRLVGSAGSGTGNALDNQITGNAGDNRLDGRAGNDTLIGDEGNDTYVVDALDRVVEAAGAGYDTVEASVSWTLGDELERLVLTGYTSTNGTGNDLDNVLVGNAYSNTLDGGLGADVMDGGDGSDTFIVDNIADVVAEVSTAGTELVRASVSHTLGSNIENLTLTGTDAINGDGNGHNNILRGNSAANVLSGQSGVDTLYGGYGNDTLISTDGVDRLYGGMGDDTYRVTGITDTVMELSGQGTDTVVATVLRSYTLGLNFENLLLVGLHVNGFGNSLANQITGTAGNNLLDGGAGADVLAGLGGNDSYVVDTSADQVVENIGGGTDQVLSSVTHTLGLNVENLTLTGAAAISGTGNSSNNRLTGNDAANTLSGLAGHDVLVGGGGNDLLYGGDGSDVFHGGAGNDRMDGGNQADVASYFSATGNVTVNLNLTSAQDTVSAGVDTLIGIESVDGSNVGNDVLTGNAQDNRLRGHGGDDVLNGGGGSDRVDGGEGADLIIGDLGNDRLDGGNGQDVLSFSAATVSVSVDLSVLGRQNTGLGHDVILNFESVEGSQTGHDVLFGDHYQNNLFGLGGTTCSVGTTETTCSTAAPETTRRITRARSEG